MSIMVIVSKKYVYQLPSQLMGQMDISPTISIPSC